MLGFDFGFSVCGFVDVVVVVSDLAGLDDWLLAGWVVGLWC